MRGDPLPPESIFNVHGPYTNVVFKYQTISNNDIPSRTSSNLPRLVENLDIDHARVSYIKSREFSIH